MSKAFLLTQASSVLAVPYWRPLSSEVRISNFIPLSNQLEIQAGTTLTTTTFNQAPYCVISEDTQGATAQIGFIVGQTLKDLVKNRFIKTANSNWKQNGDQRNGPLNLNKQTLLKTNQTFVRKHTYPSSKNLWFEHPAFTMAETSQTINTNPVYLPGPYINDNWFRRRADDTYAGAMQDGIFDEQPPIFIYMPEIEALTTSENAIKLRGCVMLETELTVLMSTNSEHREQLLEQDVFPDGNANTYRRNTLKLKTGGVDPQTGNLTNPWYNAVWWK